MQFDRAFRYLVCFTVLSYIGCVGLIWACHNNGNWTYFKIQQQTIMGVSWWRIRSRSWIIMLSFGYSIHLHSRKVIGQTVPSNRNPLITHPCQRVEPPRGCKSKCFHVCDPLTSSAPNQYDKNIYIYIFPAFVAEGCLRCFHVMTWHQHGLSCWWKRSLQTPLLQQETLHLIALREDSDLQSQLEVRLPKFMWTAKGWNSFLLLLNEYMYIHIYI